METFGTHLFAYFNSISTGQYLKIRLQSVSFNDSVILGMVIVLAKENIVSQSGVLNPRLLWYIRNRALQTRYINQVTSKIAHFQLYHYMFSPKQTNMIEVQFKYLKSIIKLYFLHLRRPFLLFYSFLPARLTQGWIFRHQHVQQQLQADRDRLPGLC